jgi:hypothetical protein
MQKECNLPAMDASDDQIVDFLKPALQLCGDFWCLLLEHMGRSSSAPKAGKALVLAIVNELVAVAWQVEWPGAQLLLYVLCIHLKDVVQSGSKTGKADVNAREERELLLEVIGHLIAQVSSMLFHAVMLPAQACYDCTCSRCSDAISSF